MTNNVGQGRAARADTRPLFSITDRVGAGQGGQGRHPPVVFSYRQGRARADTHPLFSVINRAR